MRMYVRIHGLANLKMPVRLHGLEYLKMVRIHVLDYLKLHARIHGLAYVNGRIQWLANLKIWLLLMHRLAHLEMLVRIHWLSYLEMLVRIHWPVSDWLGEQVYRFSSAWLDRQTRSKAHRVQPGGLSQTNVGPMCEAKV